MSSDHQWRVPNSTDVRGSNARLIPDKGADTSKLLIRELAFDPLWTPEQVAQRLNVSPDWVRDHSSRKEPRLPVIRLAGGTRYSALAHCLRDSRASPVICE